jgi:hypothetical protein
VPTLARERERVQTPQEKEGRTAVFQESQAQATRPPWPTHPPQVRTRSIPPVYTHLRALLLTGAEPLCLACPRCGSSKHTRSQSGLGKWDAACCLQRCTRVRRTPSLPICLAPVSSLFSHVPSNERGGVRCSSTPHTFVIEECVLVGGAENREKTHAHILCTTSRHTLRVARGLGGLPRALNPLTTRVCCVVATCRARPPHRHHGVVYGHAASFRSKPKSRSYHTPSAKSPQATPCGAPFAVGVCLPPPPRSPSLFACYDDTLVCSSQRSSPHGSPEAVGGRRPRCLTCLFPVLGKDGVMDEC